MRTRGAHKRSPCCMSHTRLPYSGCHASSPSCLHAVQLFAQSKLNHAICRGQEYEAACTRLETHSDPSAETHVVPFLGIWAGVCARLSLSLTSVGSCRSTMPPAILACSLASRLSIRTCGHNTRSVACFNMVQVNI